LRSCRIAPCRTTRLVLKLRDLGEEIFEVFDDSEFLRPLTHVVDVEVVERCEFGAILPLTFGPCLEAPQQFGQDDVFRGTDPRVLAEQPCADATKQTSRIEVVTCSANEDVDFSTAFWVEDVERTECGGASSDFLDRNVEIIAGQAFDQPLETFSISAAIRASSGPWFLRIVSMCTCASVIEGFARRIDSLCISEMDLLSDSH
jgi:hypothetical protein